MPTPTHDHHMRPIVPLLDLDHDQPNRCSHPRCRKPPRYVHTWRHGIPPNSTHRSHLLCDTHARRAAAQHLPAGDVPVINPVN